MIICKLVLLVLTLLNYGKVQKTVKLIEPMDIPIPIHISCEPMTLDQEADI